MVVSCMVRLVGCSKMSLCEKESQRVLLGVSARRNWMLGTS